LPDIPRAATPPSSRPIKVTVWNVEWAKPGTVRGKFFVQRFSELASDILCVTEGYRELLPENGHVIASEPDYGYPIRPGRRKVLLWSRTRWTDVDSSGDPSLPPGRFVAWTTTVHGVAVRCFGVCIPWRDAHVRTGRRDREPWQDHQTYLHHLHTVLANRATGTPATVLGDFNQRIPRKGQPLHVFASLMAALSCGFEVLTEGKIHGAQAMSIDHVAATESLDLKGVEHLDRVDNPGVAMSDHFGLEVSLVSSASD
jgi:hypothetical protein